jgi:hypothetical protein
MNAAACTSDTAAKYVDPLEAFRARCWARARLFAAGELGLHQAVDALQADAISSGLVHQIGQDVAQSIMAREFARARGMESLR